MPDSSRVEIFVGKRCDYYTRKWSAMESEGGSRLSFNWPAFFVPAAWLVYRKLYRHFFALVAVLTADALLTSYLQEAAIVPLNVIAIWDRISILVYAAVIATFGNHWYLQRFRKVDIQADRVSAEPAAREEFIRSNGGTNANGAMAVVGVALLMLVAAPFVFAPNQATNGHKNLLSVVPLLMSIVFAIIFSVRATRESTYKAVKIPLLSILFFFILAIATGGITKAVEHYWYSWAAKQYGDQSPHVLAIRDLEPEIHRQFEANVLVQAKQGRLELEGIMAVAKEQAGQQIIPLAREYYSFSSDTSVLRLAEAHLALLDEVAERHVDACANHNLGVEINSLPANSKASTLLANMRQGLVNAIKSGGARKPVESPSPLLAQLSLARFQEEFPEFDAVWASRGQGEPDVESQVFCDARLELVGFMLQQDKSVAASFFRQYY